MNECTCKLGLAHCLVHGVFSEDAPMTTTPTPSAGAIRAAENIVDRLQYALPIRFGREVRDEMAVIIHAEIDRELTAATAQLEEARSHLLRVPCGCFTHFEKLIQCNVCKALAAMQQKEGK